MTKRLLAATAAAAALMAAPATSAQAQVTAPGAPAQVTACNNDFVGGQNNSSGTLSVPSGATWRKGPGEGYCALTSRSGLAYAWCKKFNSAGNLWYLARDASSSQLGWIWAGNINGTSGTINNC